MSADHVESDDPWNRWVIPHFPDVISALKPSILRDHLFANKLLTLEEMQTLRSKPSEIEAARYLLLDVLFSRLPKQETFDKFCEILRKTPQQRAILDVFPHHSTSEFVRERFSEANAISKSGSTPHVPGNENKKSLIFYFECSETGLTSDWSANLKSLVAEKLIILPKEVCLMAVNPEDFWNISDSLENSEKGVMRMCLIMLRFDDVEVISEVLEIAMKRLFCFKQTVVLRETSSSSVKFIFCVPLSEAVFIVSSLGEPGRKLHFEKRLKQLLPELSELTLHARELYIDIKMHGFGPDQRLHFLARKNGSLETIKHLLAQADSPKSGDLHDVQGNTPLILASQWKQSQYVNLLLKAGADANQSNSLGYTALHYAAAGGDVETIQLLHKHGASLDVTTKRLRRTPLVLALRNDRLEAVRILISLGADVMQAGKFGQLPLHETMSVTTRHLLYETVMKTFSGLRKKSGQFSVLPLSNAAHCQILTLLTWNCRKCNQKVVLQSRCLLPCDCSFAKNAESSIAAEVVERESIPHHETDPTNSDINLCSICETFRGKKISATYFCSDCNAVFCNECFEFCHREPERSGHKCWKIAQTPYETLPTNKIWLSEECADFLNSLPASSLPWKAVAPSLFRLLEVVFDVSGSNSVLEKIVVVEEELSSLCNAFSPKSSSSADCSKIDFDALKKHSVTAIGLVGDQDAVKNLLQTHLRFSSADYDKMTDSEICPSGLYALMPNRTAVFLFYWTSSRYVSAYKNRSITCQMLRHIRDLCDEIVVCFDKKTLSNLKLIRPAKEEQSFHQNVVVRCERIEQTATASVGFHATFEPTEENVVVSNSLHSLYLCSPRSDQIVSRAFTLRRTFMGYPKEVCSHFDSFKDYRVIWKARSGGSWLHPVFTLESIRVFLRVAFPHIERKLEMIDDNETKAKQEYENKERKLKDLFEGERQSVQLCWKKEIVDFLKETFAAEETIDELNLEPCVVPPGDCKSMAKTLFSRELQERIKKDFYRLRKRTSALQHFLSTMSTVEQPTIDEEEAREFYNLSVSTSQALSNLESARNVLAVRVAKRFLKRFFPKKESGVDSSKFKIPEERVVKECHLKYYRILRGEWILKKCPYNSSEQWRHFRKDLPSEKLDLQLKSFEEEREQIVRVTSEGREFGDGSLLLKIHEFASLAGKFKLTYEKEYYEGAKIKFDVCKLDVPSSELAASSVNQTLIHPVFSHLKGAEFSIVKNHLEVRALYSMPETNLMLLLAYLKPADENETRILPQKIEFYNSTGGMIVFFGKWASLTKANVIKCIAHKNIYLTAFDAEKRLLALYDASERHIAIYEFSDYVFQLRSRSEHSMKDFFTGAEIVHMQIISEREILLVDSGSQASIYDVKRERMTSGTLKLGNDGETLSSVITFKEFVLTISQRPSYSSMSEEGRGKEATSCDFCVRAYSSSSFKPVGKHEIHCFVDKNRHSQFRLIQLSEQLHLVCLDFSAGSCQSVCLNLISSGNTLKVSSSEADDDSAKLEKNEILENFYEIFRKYSISHCFSQQLLQLKITFVIVKEIFSLKEFQRSMQVYFRNMFRALEKETGKEVKHLVETMRLRVCSSDCLSDVLTCRYKPCETDQFILTVATCVPIQIARAENNLLCPLSKGVNLCSLESLNDVLDLVGSISFGVYEAVLMYAKKPTKIISVKGKQNAGKSYFLNHMTGAQFDIAGGRCTEGVWMSVKLYENVTIIALDFEGLGSFERSRQEDMLMAVFGAAVSSLTVFKTSPCFDKEAKKLFDRFQDGARFLQKSDSLFKGKLVILCKDVPLCDSRETRKEITDKILYVLSQDMQNNFVQKLYNGDFEVATSAVFGSQQFFEIFSWLSNLLCQRRESDLLELVQKDEPSAVTVANLMKTVLAKIYLNDWTPLDRVRINKLVAFIRQNADAAVMQGCTFDADKQNRLGKFGTNESQLIEDEIISQSLSEADFGLELFAASPQEKRTVRKQIITKYMNKNNEKIGTFEWCGSFKTEMKALVERRITRVEKWICINTEDFQEDGNVRSLTSDVKNLYFNPLRQFWTVCCQKCKMCDRLCLKEYSHFDSTGDQSHDCYTDHRCAKTCSFCSSSCRHCGGHAGKHQCINKTHTCKEKCDLSEYRRCLGICAKEPDHTNESDTELRSHRCGAKEHYCIENCELAECFYPCAKLYDHLGRHSCLMDCCPRSCILCSNRCAVNDHFHPLLKDAVHICQEEHDCKSECEIPGYCVVDPGLEDRTETFVGNRSCFEFSRRAMQVPKKFTCSRSIPSGQTTHPGLHGCSTVVHTCKETCPTCGNICTKSHGHQGLHRTNHSNMRNQVFVNQKIVFRDRIYCQGDSALAEMCDQFCKRLGRGHTHIMLCPFQGKHNTDDPRLRHGVQIKCDVDPLTKKIDPLTKKILDEVTHDYYWEHFNFEDNCTEEEKCLFRKCNYVCDTVDNVSGLDVDSNSFCQLPLWHDPLCKDTESGHSSSGGHHFLCEHETNFHVVLLIDRSSSMGWSDQQPSNDSNLKGKDSKLDNRLGAVLESVDNFCQRLSERAIKDWLTLITFSDQAQTLFFGRLMSGGVSETVKDKVKSPEGNTKFAPALKEAKEAILKKDEAELSH
ncbi:uncharacterized protein [Oscarella lobularis]|uniref:uncharacterized protein n=1 Tax=Oscarella lobularis TaxID=121494 RepID=UPI003313CA7B